MATIQDIAEEVGISKAAVSRILNKKGSFSEETIQKVERAARRLNYVPMSALRRDHESSDRRIAVVLPRSTAPYYGLIATLADRYAYNYQYEVTLCGSAYDGENDDEFYAVLKRRGVSGVLMVSFEHGAEALSRQGIPVVAVGFPGFGAMHSVRSNNVSAGMLAARHLISRGCKRLLYATRFPDGTKYDERWRGFHDEAVRQGVEVWPYEFATHGVPDDEKNVITQMVLDHPDADGMFVESFRLTARIYQTLGELGYRIPEDFRMIGHGTASLACYSGVDFSYIQEDTSRIVEQAISQLVEMIESDGKPGDDEMLIPVALHVGRTS